MTDPKPAKPTRAPAAKPGASKPAASKPAAAKPAARKPPVATATAKATAKPSTTVPPIVPAPVVAATSAATAPAGWYPVAAGSSQQRWWDGSAWTDHVHDPAATGPTGHTLPKAPEGTNPTTLWIWLTAVSPVIAIVSYVFLSIYLDQFATLYADTSTAFSQLYTSPTYLTFTLLGFVALAASIVFPILDARTLEKRGVPKPFHWAWSLAAIVISTPIIYVIGRTVVAKRRTGKGMAPMWVFIALQVIAWIVGFVVIIVFIVALFTQFANLLNDSNEVF